MSDPNQLDRLQQQLRFILEIDKLKSIFRQSYLLDQSRKENDAEHSWHLAVMAVLLWEHAADPSIDLLRVIKMVVVHDMVEIDAGDVFVYDERGRESKLAREQEAAERVFGLLPVDQAVNMRALWEEFEAGLTPEAQFANAIDRLEPILLNIYTQGRSWREHGITADKVLAKNIPILAASSPLLAEYVEGLIREAVSQGHLAPAPDV